MPLLRISPSDSEPAFSPGDLEGTLQPATVTCDGLSSGPAQNGDGLVRNQTAKLAALFENCACGAASSKSPSMYRTYVSPEPARRSACTAPTTMLQSHPISRGTWPGCLR